MSDQCDFWDHHPAEMIASGPYLFDDWGPAYLRVIYDALSNSASVTLLVWADHDGWWPISSLVWCPGEESLIENTSDDEWPNNPLLVSFSREPEFYHRFRRNSLGVLEFMFAYARHSETLKGLTTLTPAMAAKLIEDDDNNGLSEQLETIGTHNLYPLDGADYEYRFGRDAWDPLGSSIERLPKLHEQQLTGDVTT